MKQNTILNFIMISICSSIAFTFLLVPSFAQSTELQNDLFADAYRTLLDGEYSQSIIILDKILVDDPTNSKALEMKGLAYSNMRLGTTLASQQQNQLTHNPSNLNKLSMLEFYKVLEINPNSVLALNGMGLGFGNFGEYLEAKRYFKKSLVIEPDNTTTQNYIKSLEKLRKKYSLDVFETPTKKPDFLLKLEQNTIPTWIKNNAGWWSKDQINDDDFITGIEYLINNKIIKLNSYNSKTESTNKIPTWIKNNAEWWSKDQINDDDFIAGIEYLIENNIIKVNVKTDSQLDQKELERKAWNFERYMLNIQNDIKKQNRYVENINPSEYVIIKYWKDYHKWNLEQFLHKPEIFPDRNVWIDSESGKYVIEYQVYINEQPPGLPIDHISTLADSFRFWEQFEFDTVDGKKATAKFYSTNVKSEANVWVTWVVRDLGEGVLGHANLGKGVVEVAIGGYGCDGSFQLFDVDTVEYIMTHELGHSLGLTHSSNKNNIMYGSIPQVGYEFCLLN